MLYYQENLRDLFNTKLIFRVFFALDDFPFLAQLNQTGSSQFVF